MTRRRAKHALAVGSLLARMPASSEVRHVELPSFSIAPDSSVDKDMPLSPSSWLGVRCLSFGVILGYISFPCDASPGKFKKFNEHVFVDRRSDQDRRIAFVVICNIERHGV